MKHLWITSPSCLYLHVPYFLLVYSNGPSGACHRT